MKHRYLAKEVVVRGYITQIGPSAVGLTCVTKENLYKPPRAIQPPARKNEEKCARADLKRAESLV